MSRRSIRRAHLPPLPLEGGLMVGRCVVAGLEIEPAEDGRLQDRSWPTGPASRPAQLRPGPGPKAAVPRPRARHRRPARRLHRQVRSMWSNSDPATVVGGDERHDELFVAWQGAQQLRASYSADNQARGRRIAEKLLSWLPTWPIPEASSLRNPPASACGQRQRVGDRARCGAVPPADPAQAPERCRPWLGCCPVSSK